MARNVMCKQAHNPDTKRQIMTRAAKYKADYCNKAANILSGGRSLAGVCADLDICRATLYEWRDSHPEFKAALDRGLQKAQDLLEQKGLEATFGGFDKFTPASWIFTMKNRFRNDYAEEKEDKNDAAVSVLEKILSGELKVKND